MSNVDLLIPTLEPRVTIVLRLSSSGTRTRRRDASKESGVPASSGLYQNGSRPALLSAEPGRYSVPGIHRLASEIHRELNE